MNRKLVTLIALVVTVNSVAIGAAAALADSNGPSWGPATPNFNLEVVLRPAAGGPERGFGLVKFRQPKDSDKIVYLDTWVRDLGPNSSYSLQRATDSNVNDACTGTNWLTLGQGTASKAITTDESGSGRADLFRSLAMVPLGMQFDIHFRVIVTGTSTVALESACYQFTVSQ